MWTVTLVLIAATTLMACALLGGGLYELLVADPYSAAPTRHHLVAGWGRPEVRYALLVALASA